MKNGNGIKAVGYFDCPGGGQVVVRDRIAYVGHIKPPHGTSIIDVGDPARPRKLAEIKTPEGTLSHKVRVENGIMLVNREIFPIGRQDPNFRGGLEVFDVSRPRRAETHRELRLPRHASLHLRRPLRLRLAGDRRLSRQHRRHHRLQGSGAAARWSARGGCRGSGPRAARRRPGKAPIIAAITRCAPATGSM